MTLSIAMAVVVLVVAAGDDPATTDAAVRSAQATLPSDSRVILSRDATTDASALARERAESASGVVILSAPNDSRRARLRVHRREDNTWVDREIVFDANDGAAERGRTLGFAVASMFPEAPSPTASPAPPSAPPPTPRPAPAPIARAASASEPPDTGAPRASTPPRLSVDAAVLAATGIAGYAGGVGGRGGVDLRLGSRAGLRFDATFRRGEVTPAQSTSLVVGLGPGLRVDFVSTDPAHAFGVGMRVNALALLHMHSHLSDEPEPVVASRWLPGASGVVEGSLRLSDSASFLGSAGVEGAFGHTDVYVHGRRVAVIPPVRLIADLGVRVRF